jgi:hypothetical protein
MVVTKDKYYALVIEDSNLAGKFLNADNRQNTLNLYTKAYEAAEKQGITNEQASRSGVLAIVGNSGQTGIGFYEAKRISINFIKVN